MKTSYRRNLAHPLLALLLAATGLSASAAEQAAWVGSVTLPALLERLAPAPPPDRPQAARLLAPVASSAPGCLAVPVPAPALPLLQHHAQAQARLRIAELFFAAQAAEDEENISTELVAASYGRATKPAPDLSEATRAGFELAYREAFARREAARLQHRLARLALGQAVGGERALGEALDTQSLGWPAAGPEQDAEEAQAAKALSGQFQLQALHLLRDKAPANCRAALTGVATELRQRLTLDLVEQRGRLRLALQAERHAARLRQSLAETQLDQAREALAAAEAGSAQAALALYAAEIESARAAAALGRVHAAAVLADLRLQALQGRLPTPPAAAAQP